MKRQSARKALIFISFLFFPLTIFYLSPYLIVLGASEGIAAGSFVFFSLLFFFSLFLGRAYCGWLCPGAGLQECCQIVSDRKTKGGKLDLIKYFIWVPWITGIVIAAAAAGGLKSIDISYHTWYGISVAQPGDYIIYYGVVILIVILAFTAGKRSFCHYTCWMAPFMMLGSKIKELARIPSLHLVSIKEKCIRCKKCDKACQMSLAVSDMVERGSMTNPECILCGECVDSCPKGAINYSFGIGLPKIERPIDTPGS